MDRYVALDTERHRGWRVRTYPSADFGDAAGMVGVTPHEFSRLIAHYPIFLRKDAETGLFEPGAMMGFAAEENLFLDNDEWDAAYLPLNTRRGPFTIAPSANAKGKNSILIDAGDPRVNDREGEILFLAGGHPSDYLQGIVDILHNLVDGVAAGQAYAAKLTEFDLIESVRVEVEFADRTSAKLHGLYSINVDRLGALSGAQLAELRDLGFLEWIYVQLASLAHVPAMITRRNKQSLLKHPTTN